MNKYKTIQEEYGLKEVIIWLCSNKKHANLSGANLSGANLTGAKLWGVNLSHANLTGIDLYYANLSHVNLTYANLDHADLSHVNLTGANLWGTNLTCANLWGTNLTGTDFDFSCLNLSCNGINLNFDERVIKQLANHFLKQNNHSEVYKEIKITFLSNPKWLNWLESWHRKDEVKHLKEFVKH